MIELKELTVTLGDKRVFDRYSAELPDKGIVIVSGESGIGKTTLLRVLCGLVKPENGMITGLSGRKISVVFQEPRLLEQLTALENVALVSDRTKAEFLLNALNMHDELHVKAASLSGGQKQRVSLARAFAFSNDVVLLDEPFTGLDEHNKQKAADLIRSARLAVVVTHDPADAALLNSNRKIQL